MSDKASNTSLSGESLFSVQGKVALITGGSSGLGYSMAEGLLKAGARVYICSRKAPQCEEAARALSALGDCIALPTDVADASQRQALVDALSKREPAGLSILVNNAGSNWGAQIEDYPDSAFDKVMKVNVSSVFSMTRDLLPLLEKTARADCPARIVNIGSMDGLHVPIASRVPTFAYSASKAALHHLTHTIAVDLGPRHVTVNAIAPGFFPSKMTGVVLDKYLQDIEDDCPLGRVGQESDIMGTLQFLVSPAGAYVNGAIIPLDGGTHLSKGRRDWMNE